MTVLILGCGRSGTSIFGELFEGLPGFRYYFEPSMEAVADIDFATGPVAVKVPKAPHGSPMTPGLPFVLGELLAKVPAPRAIFWQVRHPLDAICSLRPGIEANWSHNPKPPGWESMLGRLWVERCARHWAFINGPGFDAVSGMATVFRYEDMIADPRQTALRACALAGVDAAGAEDAVKRWSGLVSNDKSPGSYEAKHQSLWSRADHAVRSGRWRENLSEEELQCALPFITAAAARFGYELPGV